ncbi:carboxylesterase/lipase family protein [Cohnella caldifontis]|uniref:carboxylesterase/lipase family protein n=1 Tax=Cohnella caldifontis TaxID=3027471 RepID=UPI0023EB7E57|nr:carboxylesterase/lipase family protein [Cohnella sp. YIM B05605]
MRTLVDTRYGKLQGRLEDGIGVWRGVPYAQPPTGPLRFRPPQPPEAWSGIRDASDFGPAAKQILRENRILSPKGHSEDCLYLNIWSPGADDRRRPVMVWIHGGFFAMGSGSDPRFDGATFARSGDTVLVTINYRLGALGFLQLRGIGGPEYDECGNLGLQDQVAALRWIRENIAAFGGDPNRVTIFGQSAGGRSVGALLAMPSAAGLFQQAIIHSGGLRTYTTTAGASEIAASMLAKLKVPPEEIGRLRSLTAESLLEAAPPLRAGRSLEPTVGGPAFPAGPLKAAEAGAARNINVMIGYTRNDFTRAFDPRWAEMGEEELLQDFAGRIGPLWPEISPYYLERERNEPDLAEKLLPLLIRNEFIAPAVRLAELQIRHGATVRMFRFDRQNPNTGYAMHGDELPYVFNRPNPYDDPALAERMFRAWIAFARTGDPNAGDGPDWPAYDTERRSVMVFDAESRVEDDPCREERQQWEQAERRLSAGGHA